jgi:hypothetical protein
MLCHLYTGGFLSYKRRIPMVKKIYNMKRTISVKRFIIELGENFSEHVKKRLLDLEVRCVLTQRLRMDVISQNIANASTTRTESGTPYRRKFVVFEEKSPANSFSKSLYYI